MILSLTVIILTCALAGGNAVLMTGYTTFTDSVTTTDTIYVDNYDTINIENAILKRYLDEVTYDLASPSVITDYSSLWSSYRKDQPAYSSNYIPGEVVCTVDTIPDDTVIYILRDTILVQGRLRMLNVPGMYNMRDLGGWTLDDGGIMPYGRLFRGCEMNNHYTITSAGIDIMRGLGIKAELDTRTLEQADSIQTSPLGDDIIYRFVDLQSGYLTSLQSYPDVWRSNLRYIISCLRTGNPVYFHCQIGADRTGTMALLLEGIAGVCMSDIYKDYELTSFAPERQVWKPVRTKDQLDSIIRGVEASKGDTFTQRFHNYVCSLLGIYHSEAYDMRAILLDQPSYYYQYLQRQATTYQLLPDSLMSIQAEDSLRHLLNTISFMNDSTSYEQLDSATSLLQQRVKAARESVILYERFDSLLSFYDDKAEQLDEDGRSKYADLTLVFREEYEIRTLNKDYTNELRQSYKTAVKYQTTQGCDMTESLDNPRFDEDSTDLVMQLPRGWQLTDTTSHRYGVCDNAFYITDSITIADDTLSQLVPDLGRGTYDLTCYYRYSFDDDPDSITFTFDLPTRTDYSLSVPFEYFNVDTCLVLDSIRLIYQGYFVPTPIRLTETIITDHSPIYDVSGRRTVSLQHNIIISRGRKKIVCNK